MREEPAKRRAMLARNLLTLIAATAFLHGLPSARGQAIAVNPRTTIPATIHGPSSASAGKILAQQGAYFEPLAPTPRRQESFVARAENYSATLGPAGITVTDSGGTVSMSFRGGGPLHFRPGSPLPGVSNYLLGNDPTRWRLGVRHYSVLTASEVYPGISLVARRDGGKVELVIQARPGARPDAVEITWTGASSIGVDRTGRLHVRRDRHEITLSRPIATQDRGARRVPVPASYVVLDRRSVRLQLGRYDHSLPLAIDPVLAYASYLGGSGIDRPAGIALDPAGDIYVAGSTNSPDFPTSSGLELQCAKCKSNGTNTAGFVAKFDPSGALVYSTFLSGSQNDAINGLAVDQTGDAYVVGTTSSSDFPTASALYGSCGPCATYNNDAFVAELGPSGANLIYSTFLGPAGSTNGSATGWSIGIDSQGDAYVAGTANDQFPTTPGAYSATGQIFIAKIASGGSSLPYSTRLQGSGGATPFGMTVDSAGEAIITGYGQSIATTAGAYQTCGTNSSDVFLTKFNASGTALIFSTCLHGSVSDIGYSVALDKAGNEWIAGRTNSPDFPVTSDAIQSSCQSCGQGPNNGFLAALDPTGSALLYSTYLGAGDTQAAAVAADSASNIYVAGGTASTTYTQKNAFDQTPPLGNGGDMGFITEISSSHSLLLSSYVPVGFVFGIAAATNGALYIAGQAQGVQIPSLPGAFQGTARSSENAVLEVIGDPALSLGAPSLTFADRGIGTSSGSQSVSLSNSGNVQLAISSVTVTGDFQASNNCGATLAPGSQCTVAITFTPSATGSRPGVLSINDNASTSPQTVTLSGTGELNSQTITFSPIPSETYGTTVQLGASATSGLAVTYSVTGPAGISGTTLTTTGVGAVTVTASQAGNADYAAASPIAQSFTIKPATLTITADNAATAYGSVLPSFAASISGFVNGDTAAAVSGAPSFSTSATAASPPATYPITPEAGTLAASNYDFIFVPGTLTIAKADQTITFASIPNQTYGAGPITLSATASSGLAVAFTIVSGPATVSGNTLTTTGIGAVVVEADQAGNSDYNAAAAARQSFSIGAAASAAVAVAPSGLTFATQTYNTTSATQIVTITNTGSVAVSIFSISTTGDFADTTTCSASLSISASCTVSVAFTPTAAGARSGSLTVSDSTGNSPQSVPLSGTGSDLAFAPASGGSINASVAPGQTAAYSLTLTPLQGLSDTVSLACTGAPQGATCKPSPATAQLSGGAPVAVSITVSTTGNSQTVPLGLDLPPLLLTGLGLLGLALSCATKRRREIFVTAAVFVMLATAVACGGGGSTTTSGGGGSNGSSATPAGAYTLTLSASDSNGVVGSTTLTLVVQ